MIEKTDKVALTVEELIQLCEICVLTDRKEKPKTVDCSDLVKSFLRRPSEMKD